MTSDMKPIYIPRCDKLEAWKELILAEPSIYPYHIYLKFEFDGAESLVDLANEHAMKGRELLKAVDYGWYLSSIVQEGHVFLQHPMLDAIWEPEDD